MERKWYYHTLLAKLNDDEPVEVSNISKCYCYLTEEEAKEKTTYREINNFEYAKVCAQESMWHYISYQPKTLFCKEKLAFRLDAYWFGDGHKWLTKEEFKSYILYDSYTILKMEHYSLEEIMRHSSADDFIKYMKDNGMTTCPMIK